MAELDALRAENRRLRREAGDREAFRRIRSDTGQGRTFTREELAETWESVSDRGLRFPTGPGTNSSTAAATAQHRPPGGLPPARRTSSGAGRAVSRRGTPLPGACRLHLSSDGLTTWYTVTETPEGQVVIVVQYVKADT